MRIIDRINLLRNLMQFENIDALLIFGTDPHLSEYVPIAWRSVEWISGFTGSYGKIVITKEFYRRKTPDFHYAIYLFCV